MKRLRGSECPAFKNLPESLVLSLAATIEKMAPVVQEAAAADAAAPATAAAATTP